MLNILVIGSGGREHALCWKIRQSSLCGELYCAPGNGGIWEVATCIALKDVRDTIAFCKEKDIGLVVVGPEQPLVDGVVDMLKAEGIVVFGPSKRAAQLEGSKAFTKKLCDKYNIPTAAYEEFTDLDAAENYIQTQSYPLVIKADGLAAGKGVVIAEDVLQAADALQFMFQGGFGAAGKKVVIEEFLTGTELSFFALCDGNTAVEFGSAQDHKRAYDNDQGPNTGGMGTYSPPPLATKELHQQIMETIVLPTVAGMKNDGAPFQGVLFAGLMLTKEGPKLIEYNTRFGDPETQVLMARLNSDLVPLLLASANGNLGDATVHYKSEDAVCVVMAAKGYPGEYKKHTVIQGLEQARSMANVMIFHAGTERHGEEIQAVGGRVLGVTALGSTIKDAQAKAYQAVSQIDWPDGFYRKDIANSAI